MMAQVRLASLEVRLKLKINPLHFLQSPRACHLCLLRLCWLRTCEHKVDVLVVVLVVVVAIVGARVGERKGWGCVTGINIEWLFNGARFHEVRCA